MAKHTLKILRCEHHKVFKVCLAIFQHHELERNQKFILRNEYSFNGVVALRLISSSCKRYSKLYQIIKGLEPCPSYFNKCIRKIKY